MFGSSVFLVLKIENFEDVNKTKKYSFWCGKNMSA